MAQFQVPGLVSWVLCWSPLLMISSICYGEHSLLPAMYVFGDSISDVGNNNYLNLTYLKFNHPHYGIDFPTHLPTGRCTNGKNTVDLLADEFGITSPSPYLALHDSSNRNRAFLKGVNFASAGAGILDETYQGLNIPLNKQIYYYSTEVYAGLVQQLGPVKAMAYLNKSLIVINVGSNDLIWYYQQSAIFKLENAPERFVDSLIISLRRQIKLIYNYGGRKVLSVGAGPLGCIPLLRLDDVFRNCIRESNEMTVEFNRRVMELLQELKDELPGMVYTFVNVYTAMSDYILRPASYGFTEVKVACCGTGDLNAQGDCNRVSPYCSNRTNHVFWDRWHPTTAVYELLSKLIFDGNSSYISPMTLRQLISM